MIMNLQIIAVKYIKPLSVEIHFSDGIVKTLDVGAFIKSHPHPQYNAYLDERKFKQFKIDMGNLVWGKNWDLVFPVTDLHKGILSM